MKDQELLKLIIDLGEEEKKSFEKAFPFPPGFHPFREAHLIAFQPSRASEEAKKLLDESPQFRKMVESFLRQNPHPTALQLFTWGLGISKPQEVKPTLQDSSEDEGLGVADHVERLGCEHCAERVRWAKAHSFSFKEKLEDALKGLSVLFLGDPTLDSCRAASSSPSPSYFDSVDAAEPFCIEVSQVQDQLEVCVHTPNPSLNNRTVRVEVLGIANPVHVDIALHKEGEEYRGTQRLGSFEEILRELDRLKLDRLPILVQLI